MTQSRQAFSISIIYSIPLLLWFSAQLQYIDWNSLSLQHLFRQTLFTLVMLQVFAITLLFTMQTQKTWQDDLLAILFVILYPLPFLLITGLSGGTSINALLSGSAIVGAAGGLSFLIQFCGRRITSKWWIIKTGLSSTHILTAVLIWNFRDLWQNWLD